MAAVVVVVVAEGKADTVRFYIYGERRGEKNQLLTRQPIPPATFVFSDRNDRRDREHAPERPEAKIRNALIKFADDPVRSIPLPFPT